jgi:NTP pyrophosphatase (non-canonical NTP hydrolase)
MEVPSDPSTTIAELKQLVDDFVRERDWSQFHSPKNLAMALAVEAAELMEHFQWIEVADSRTASDNPEKRAAVVEEIADVLAYTLAMANSMGVDLSRALHAKMVKNAQKYPADEFQGRHGGK